MKTSAAYIVYIVKCADGTLYTGITTDIERRLQQHNGELPGGAKYTKARQPVTLCYQETCPSRSAAAKREYEIRTLPRTKKESLFS